LPEEKVYKFISICEREKPIQTNNRRSFIRHVAFCPTCQEKLPSEAKNELEPELSELIAMSKPIKPPAKEPIMKLIPEEMEEGTKEGPKTEAELPPAEEVAKQEEKAQKAKFDGLVKDSPSFKDLAKSVGDIKADVGKLGTELSGLSEQLTSGLSSLGDTIMQKMTKRSEEEPEEVLEEPRTDEVPPDGTPPGRGAQPFGEPGEIPAAMRKDYKADKTPPSKKTLPSEEPSETKEPEVVEPASKKGGLPDLDTPEQMEAMEAYLEQQKEKFGEKKGEEKLPIKPWLKEVRENVREVRGIIDAIRGGGGGGDEGEGSKVATAGGDFENMLKMLKAVNELTISNVRGVMETIKAVREGEKLLSPSKPSASEETPKAETGRSEHIA